MVDRRLFGARPRGYGPWCLEMALAAEQGKAASFYLRELFDCVMEGTRADGLTVEAARASLAPDEALVNQFDEMVERRPRAETRTERQTAQESSEDTESPGDTAEQRTWQADIEARTPALRAGRGVSRIWRFVFSKVLGNMDFWADRLPAPPPLPLYEECFRCASIVQGRVRLSAGRRAGPHAGGSTGTSCAAVRLSCASVRQPRVRVAGRRSIVVR